MARKYTPMLSTPFGRDGYREFEPCGVLKPYIRCFWTERRTDRSILVIPDTCMDIIFKVGENDRADSFFCALDERSFYSQNGGAELFGIRFYAWTAQLFSRRDLSETGGGAFGVEEYFEFASELNLSVSNANTAEERAAAAERCLMARLEKIRANSDLLNAVNFTIDSRGRAKISDLCAHTAVSARQLERLFARAMGVSPKTFSSLVRYQLLWRDMVSGRFDVLDAVEKFGYSDQAHLLNDFRRRHLMSPKRAVEYAINNK